MDEKDFTTVALDVLSTKTEVTSLDLLDSINAVYQGDLTLGSFHLLMKNLIAANYTTSESRAPAPNTRRGRQVTYFKITPKGEGHRNSL